MQTKDAHELGFRTAVCFDLKPGIWETMGTASPSLCIFVRLGMFELRKIEQVFVRHAMQRRQSPHVAYSRGASPTLEPLGGPYWPFLGRPVLLFSVGFA